MGPATPMLLIKESGLIYAGVSTYLGKCAMAGFIHANFSEQIIVMVQRVSGKCQLWRAIPIKNKL